MVGLPVNEPPQILVSNHNAVAVHDGAQRPVVQWRAFHDVGRSTMWGVPRCGAFTTSSCCAHRIVPKGSVLDEPSAVQDSRGDLFRTRPEPFLICTHPTYRRVPAY